jgi:hypothetical protein
MKKSLFTLIALCITFFTFAQSPLSFNYQAVARNNTGAVLANQPVGFQISILLSSTSGPSVYVETHSVTTNNFGLANLAIGTGTVVSGTFSNINWGGFSHFVQIEMDETGGSNYQLMGTSQLLSVPYAMHATTVENDNVDDADNDPANEYNTGVVLNGTDLEITDGGGTQTVDLGSLSSGGGSPTSLEIRKVFMVNVNDYIVDLPWVQIYTNGNNGDLTVEVPSAVSNTVRLVVSKDYGTPAHSNITSGNTSVITGLSGVSVNITVSQYSNTGPGGLVNFFGTGMANGWIIGHVMFE